MTDNQERTYKIHEDRMKELEKKLKRIQRKCKKYGNPFTYEVVGSEVVNIEKDTNKEPLFRRINYK